MSTASTAAAPVGRWTTGRVVEVVHEGTALLRVRLEVADRVDHLPGQHYVVRLRADDGYTAQRSYSVASDPGDPLLELLVEHLPGGEVSGFLHEVLEVGDVLELRGPIGGWFTWGGAGDLVPAVCVVGGTGVVPAVAMLRHARRLGVSDRLRVVAVGRTRAALPYAEELCAAGALVALTRENFTGADGSVRVAAPPYVDEVRDLVEGVDRAYVCGSAGFASFATRLLGEAGMRATGIRVEQFGASG